MEPKTLLGWLDEQQTAPDTNGDGPVTKAREDDPHVAPSWHGSLEGGLSGGDGPLTEARGDDPETAARLDDDETRAREDD